MRKCVTGDVKEPREPSGSAAGPRVSGVGVDAGDGLEDFAGDARMIHAARPRTTGMGLR